MRLLHGGGGMRWVSFMAVVAVVALTLGGCDSSPSGQGASPPTDESPDVATGNELPETDTPAESTPEASPEASPPDETRVTRLPSNLDLIPSTNPDQRVQAVQTERSDPFSLVPTTPSVQIEIFPTNETPNQPTQPTQPAQTAPATTTGTRSPANQPVNRSGNGGQSTATNRSGNGSGGLAPIPNLVPRNPATPTAVAPPPPQPTLARAVEVLGVVQIGNVPYAIVNAPNEPTSRYVREGQSLANGQVMVRRIDALTPEPIVVFEQFGVEVTATVGQGGGTETTDTSPTAAIATEQPSG